jgi:hypothetical protein
VFEKFIGVGKLSPDRFAALVARVGRDIGLLESPTIDMESFAIRDGSRRINLTNIYRGFLATPRRERLEMIRNAIHIPDELPATWDEVADNVLPNIRDGGYLRITGLHLQAHAAAHPESSASWLARRELADGLYAGLAVDLPHSMALVSEEQLATWNIEIDEALDRAVLNLQRKSDEPFEEVGPGLWMDRWNDSYSASRILLPHLLHRLCTDPVVCVPNRDTLLVCDPSSEVGLAGLVLILERLAEEESYTITRRLYQLEGIELRPFELPADNPAASSYRYLAIAELCELYRQEKEILDQRGDEDLFIASVMVTETEDGELTTRAVWTRDVPTLLTPVDIVGLVDLDDDDPDEEPTLWEADWETLESAGLIAREPSPLPRWRVSPEFPDAAWLAANARPLGS